MNEYDFEEPELKLDKHLLFGDTQSFTVRKRKELKSVFGMKFGELHIEDFISMAKELYMGKSYAHFLTNYSLSRYRFAKFLRLVNSLKTINNPMINISEEKITPVNIISKSKLDNIRIGFERQLRVTYCARLTGISTDTVKKYYRILESGCKLLECGGLYYAINKFNISKANYRNTKIASDEIKKIKEMYDAGTTQRKIAEMYGVHFSTINKIIKSKRKNTN
ncbi:MAG: hypothetical protein K1X86_16780 [Ignavibacteria bacterium]|nr:hypothetical protein [Ignavibacteria bacterium]